MSEHKKKTLLQGAAVLMIGNIMVKLIGAFYSIPLMNIIGEIGYSYYQIGYNFYTLLFVISTAGLPATVSKMVSTSYALGKYSEIKRIFSVALTLFVVVGLAGFAALFFGAQTIAVQIEMEPAADCIRMIAPAVLFIAIVATYRGFFQGLQNMVPTATSEITEAMCKLIFGLGIAEALVRLSQPDYIISAGAITGVTIGTLCAALALTGIFAFSKERRRTFSLKDAPDAGKPRSRGAIAAQIVRLAVPITISAAVITLTNIIDSWVVPGSLRAIGYNHDEAAFLYGSFSGMSQKLFNLPVSLIFSLSISAIPIISAAHAVGDRKGTAATVNSAMRICTMLAVPAGVGLAVLSNPILSILYYARPNGVAVAAPLLTEFGFAITFVCLVSLTNAILQAVGLERVPVITMLIGGVIKYIGNIYFIRIPELNIHGAVLATNICYAVIMALNIIVIIKKAGVMPNFANIFIKPVLSAAAMGVVAAVAYHFAGGILSGRIGMALGLVVALPLAVLTYFGVFAAIRGFVREDVLMLPKGEKIAAFLEKRNLIN